MTAYERAVALERRTLRNRTAMVTIAVVAIVAAFAIVYRAGRAAESREAEIHHAAVVHDTIVKELHIGEQRIRVDTVRVRVAEQKAAAAGVAFDSAAARVLAVADTAKMVPSSLVLPEIQLCKELRDAQLEQIDELKVTVRDLDEDRTLEKRRADLAEAQLKQARPPRLGFRSGLITGVAAVIAVIHFAR